MSGEKMQKLQIMPCIKEWECYKNDLSREGMGDVFKQDGSYRKGDVNVDLQEGSK